MTPDRIHRRCFAPGDTVLHRAGVNAPDTADPASTLGCVASNGHERIRFDLDTSLSEDLTALTLQPLLWNALAERCFGGPKIELTSADLAGNPAPYISVETRGAPAVYLKVVAATATALEMDIFATPW